MAIEETTLPGVGKKHEVDLGDGSTLIIVTHNTGRREVYKRPEPDADAEKLFQVSDKLARTVGTILEGAHFQPVASEEVETMLAEGLFIEWYNVAKGSQLAGQTLEEADVGEATGVQVVAIQREGELLPGPRANTRIEAGDTVVVVGQEDDCRRFEVLLEPAA
ncbi:MAG: cation:proton antiporter regulatory subunit [Halobacteriales archaeon]